MSFGVYVHFPWCLTKCPYCDFLSVAVGRGSGAPATGEPPTAREARARLPHAQYADAVIAELAARLPALAVREVTSVFFGGGTPSLWDPAQLGRVLRAIQERCPVSKDLEVTVECNPTSVSEKHFDDLLAVGVNRVSIGVQGLEQERLRFLGRLHDPGGALEALAQAQRAGVPRVSADLIFGVYRQEPAAAAREVEAVGSLGLGHFSAYALTVEPNTRFGALARSGKLPLLDDELVAESFRRVSETAQTLGFEHYELSNFCRPGAESRHNLGYWLGHDYLGLGTGAYGTVSLSDARYPSKETAATDRSRGTSASPSRLRYRNLLVPERYQAAWTSGHTFDPWRENLSDREPIEPATSISEAIMLGLRVARGLCPEELERRFSAEFWTPARKRAAERLFARGQLAWNEDRLVIPREHWLFADRVIVDLL